MKISLVYLTVVGKATPDAPEPSYYEPFSRRFHETYERFRPDVLHELIVVACGAGDGWDCGKYQRIAPKLDCDMAVFMATPVYFWRAGWLERLALAWALFGPGLYGPMASYENQPHLRTSCIACSPHLLALYDRTIHTHNDCAIFEQSFSLKVIAAGGVCKLVTWDGFYGLQDWRKPINIFRHGDQSNCLLWDRHVDIYSAASPEEKAALAQRADGIDVP